RNLGEGIARMKHLPVDWHRPPMSGHRDEIHHDPGRNQPRAPEPPKVKGEANQGDCGADEHRSADSAFPVSRANRSDSYLLGKKNGSCAKQPPFVSGLAKAAFVARSRLE